MFEKVIPVRFDIKVYPIEAYNAGDMTLRPYNLLSSDSVTVKKLIYRARDETRINNLIYLSSTAWAIMLAAGWNAFCTNRYVRMLKYYFDWLETYDPFVEDADSAVHLRTNIKDLMVATRILLLLNASIWIFSGLTHDDDAFFELIVFIFDDPFINAVKVKSSTATLKLVMTMLSKTGVFPKYMKSQVDDVAFISTRLKADRVRDTIMYATYKDSINSDLAELESLSLKKIASKYRFLMSCELCDENMAQVRVWLMPESIVGFIRGNKKAAVLKQISQAPKLPFEPLFKENLLKLAREVFPFAHERNNVLLYEDHLATFINKLTTKSSGMGAVKLDFSFYDRSYSIISNDKTLRFFVAPHEIIPANKEEAVTRINRIFSDEQPGTVGMRLTAGRVPRGIFVMPLTGYFIESIFSYIMYFYINHHPRVTTGFQQGHPITDHIDGMIASTDVKTLIVMLDFAQFDRSERWTNVRKYLLQAFKEGIAEIGLIDKKYGPFDNIYEMLELVWSRFQKAKFKIDDVSFYLDSVISGENPTLFINSIVNLAYGETFLARIALRLAGQLQFQSFQVLGDDSKYIFHFQQLVPRLILDMQAIAIDTAAESGLLLKKAKTFISDYMYEYLKISYYRGYLIQRPSLQLISSEKRLRSANIFEIMLGYLQYFSTAIARGYDSDFLTRFGKSVWLLYRKPSRHTSFIPYFTLYVPIALGGFGRLPWNFVGQNVDAIAVLYMTDDVKIQVNVTAAILQDIRDDVAMQLASQIVKTGLVDDAIKFSDLNYPKTRRLDAYDAMQKLSDSGIQPPRFNVMNHAENIVKYALKGHPAIIKLSYLYNEKAIKKVRVYQDLISTKFSWLDFIKITEIGRVAPRISLSIIPGFDPWIKSKFLALGFGLNRSGVKRQMDIMLAARDKFVPDHLTTDYILGEILRAGGNVQVMGQILLSMGFSADNAYRIAKSTSEIIKLQNIGEQLSGYTLGGPVSSLIDSSLCGVARVVQMDEIPEVYLMRVISEIIYLYAFMSPKESVSKYHVDISTDLIAMGVNGTFVQTYFGRAFMHRTLPKQWL